MSNINEKNIILKRAKSAVISRDFVTAARLYKQLLKTDVSNVEYLTELGSIYVKAGEDAKAIPYYEQIITFYPHYVEAMNSLGAIYRRLKRYDESVAILNRALDEDRQTGSVNYNLGFTYKEMGNYDDAIDCFEIVINENPNDVLAYNHLGRIYHDRKEFQKAINSYRRGLGVDQNHPILNYNLARCYDEAKLYPDAIRCYESALKARPGWLEAIKDFSSLLIRCQKTKEASDIVHHSIELHPNDSKLLCMLGRIYLEEFDYSAAEKTFRHAEVVDGNDTEILTGLAEALEKNDKAIEALDSVSKAMEIAPDDNDIRKQFVHTLLSAEEYEAALINVQDLYTETGGKDLQVLDLMEQYFICVDDEQKANEYSNRISKLNKHYKNNLYSAAERYNQIGKTEKAEQKAKEFVAREIRNPAGYNLLGKIYSNNGNYQEAINSFDKSKNLKKPNVYADKQIAKLQGLINQTPVVPEEEPNPITPEFTNIPEDQVVLDEIVEDEVLQEEIVEEEADDSFDFSQMGGDIPFEEALKEDDQPFFDKLDELTGESEFKENSDSESVDEAINSSNNVNNSTNSGMNSGEGGYGNNFGGYNGMNNGFGMNGNGYGNANGGADGNSSGSNQDPNSDDYFDFGQFDDAYGNSSDSGADSSVSNGVPNSYSEPAAAQSQSQSQPQLKPYENQNQNFDRDMQRYLQDAMMNTSNYAVETAKDAQKLALQLADEQEALKNRVNSVEQAVATGTPLELNPTDENANGNSVATFNDEVSAEKSIVASDEDTVADENSSVLSEDENPLSDCENISASKEKKSEIKAAEELIPTIEKIIADDTIAAENMPQIDLFKKLISLSEFLPEEEKEEFLSGKPRMQMEYLIAKMSGKPGLLKTGQSLIKAGVLGEETGSSNDDSEIVATNENIRSVIKYMEKLSAGLEDKNLAKALCSNADNILEKIELEDKKSQIF